MTNKMKHRATIAITALILLTTGSTASSQPSLPGDYNDDGRVNEADYTIWRKSNINGAVGYADWRTNFGRGVEGVSDIGSPSLQLVKGGTVASNNLNANGDWVWNVNITPDYALVPDSTGTPVAATLGFISNRPVEAATRGSGFDTGITGTNANPGNVIFGWETLTNLGGTGDCSSPNPGICPVGIQVGTGANNTQVFAALGSPNHTSGAHQFLQIVADRPVVTLAAPNTTSTISVRGAHNNNGRIAQITGGSVPEYISSNFDTYNATFTRNARGGDTDLNGMVDGADYNTLVLNWQLSGRSWQHGDFDGNGFVDGGDYNILVTQWQSTYTVGGGAGASLEASGVPEPSAIALVTLVVLSGMGLFRRKRRFLMLRRTLLTALPAVALVANANAATVTLTMMKDAAGPGTWELRARSSAGDNGGIASFNIPLLDIAVLTNESSFYQLNTTNFSPGGFSELRVPATDNNAVDKTVFASQRLIPTPTPNLEYGFGQTAGDWSFSEYVAAAPFKRPAWQDNLLLASGTYPTSANPRVNINATNLSVLVFDNATGSEVVAANVVIAPGFGDFNDDGSVDAADYVIWRDNGGTEEEYNAWRANFGRTLGNGSAASNPTAVPEPHSIALLLASLAAVSWRLRLAH